jgi:hypothetical protein
MAVVVIGGYAILTVRSRLLEDDEIDAYSTMSLETLRQLRREGKISDEEFENLKKSLLASYGFDKGDAEVAGTSETGATER